MGTTDSLQAGERRPEKSDVGLTAGKETSQSEAHTTNDNQPAPSSTHTMGYDTTANPFAPSINVVYTDHRDRLHVNNSDTDTSEPALRRAFTTDIEIRIPGLPEGASESMRRDYEDAIQAHERFLQSVREGAVPLMVRPKSILALAQVAKENELAFGRVENGAIKWEPYDLEDLKTTSREFFSGKSAQTGDGDGDGDGKAEAEAEAEALDNSDEK